MQTQVTEAGPFQRRLTLTVPDADLEEAKTVAARKMSREMKIKGFRPGKAPRSIVERMVGPDMLRKEAIDEALPAAVTDALSELELRPVLRPEVEAIRDIDGGVEVDVKITLWPSLDRPPVVEGRKVTIDRPDVDDLEIDAQVDRLRERFAELEDVARPADTGDFVLINLSASRGGSPIEEASASDLLYEVGSGSFLPGLDDVLGGASSGDIRDTPSVLPDGFGDHGGAEVDLRVLVKGVKARKLPDLTDEWVADVSEFESVAEMREMLAVELENAKRAEADAEFRRALVEELVEEVDIELPEELVEAELQDSFHELSHRLEAGGIGIADYLRITGKSEDEFVDDLRSGARRTIRTRVLLESVAAGEGIEVTPDEVEAALSRIVAGQDDPEEVARRFVEGGQVDLLAGDILRRKALDRIASQATPVDGEGQAVDLSRIEVAEEIDEADDAGDGSAPEAADGIDEREDHVDDDAEE